MGRGASLVWLLAVGAPILAAAAFLPLRSHLDSTNVALLLVVVVVAVSSFGRRMAGIVAAVVAGLAYDFFWAEPFYRLTIADPYEIQTASLLVVVGAAVSELAWFGRRAQRRAERSRAYLAGAVQVVSAFSAGAEVEDDPVAVVERQVASILGLDRCSYRSEPARVGPGVALLADDGSIRVGDRRLDADREGLPTDRPIILPVRAGGRDRGYLEIVAASRWSRPSSEQRQVAVLLAGQLGEVLSRRAPAAGGRDLVRPAVAPRG